MKGCDSNEPYIENFYEQFPDNVEFDRFYKVFIADDHKELYRKEWRRVNPGWRNCCSSKITCVAVTCVAIAIAVLGLSKMI